MNDMTDKEYFEDEIKKADLRVSYSIKAFLPRILPFLLMSIASTYVLMNPKVNATFSVLFELNQFTPLFVLSILSYIFISYRISIGREKLMISSLIILGALITVAYFQQDVRIPALYLKYYLITCLSVGLLGTFYYILYAKTAYVTINQRCFVIHEGVFSRIEDTTDLSEVKDKDIQRPFFDMVLGLSRLKITLSRSIKLQMMIKNIAHEDIKKLHEYLLAHSYSTYREYRIAQDRKKGSKKGRGADIVDEQEFEDDGE